MPRNKGRRIISKDIRKFTTQQVARICQRDVATIRRWIPEGIFSEHIRVSDGYLIPENATVKYYQRISDGEVKILTLTEIAKINGITP